MPDLEEGSAPPGPSFDLEEDRIVEEVGRRAPAVVALQVPEGLKARAAGLAARIEEGTGALVVVSADPCYGACDLVEEDLGHLGVELVVHMGHSEMGDTPPSIPTLFVDARSLLDIEGALRAAVPLLPPGGRVGLLTTVQHRHALPRARELLGDAGLEVVVGEGGRRLSFPGQVLGCDLSAARAVADGVDALLVLGGGNFHAVGVALATQRPVVLADVELGAARAADERRELLLRRRAAVLARARDATTFGVVVTSRPGQRRWELAKRLRGFLLDAGLQAVLVLLREVTPERLAALGLDAFVSTACPRIAVDDQDAYPMPVLTPFELRVLLGRADWKDYALDEIG